MKPAEQPEREKLSHPFPPLYDAGSHTLILGSFPSVKSREQRFFYGHPQNRFWPVLAALYGAPLPGDIPGKRALILSHGLALWDCIASCEIAGSADASVKHAVPNDLTPILAACDIRAIFCNGRLAHQLYTKHIQPRTGREAFCLPSTSPANASWTLERLIEAWRVILEV